jgi:hypothetical protein
MYAHAKVPSGAFSRSPAGYPWYASRSSAAVTGADDGTGLRCGRQERGTRAPRRSALEGQTCDALLVPGSRFLADPLSLSG